MNKYTYIYIYKYPPPRLPRRACHAGKVRFSPGSFFLDRFSWSPFLDRLSWITKKWITKKWNLLGPGQPVTQGSSGLLA